MALCGSAFLAIWHDVAPEHDAEYVRWHTREHLAERVGVPGFERGRRLVDRSGAGERYLTLYEGSRLGVFSGADYMARLAAPTPWTQRVMPALRHLVRGACRTEISRGDFLGGAVLTLRIGLSPGADLGAAASRILELDGVVAIHVGRCESPVTEIQTVERSFRPAAGERTFDAVAIAEGIGVAALAQARPAIEALLPRRQPAEAPRYGIYELSQMMIGRAA